MTKSGKYVFLRNWYGISSINHLDRSRTNIRTSVLTYRVIYVIPNSKRLFFLLEIEEIVLLTK